MNKDNAVITAYNEPLIAQRADPYVYKHLDGNYYFTASVPEYDRIVLRKASTINGLAEAEEKTIWNKHESGSMSIHVWAPELHYIDGKWYIYYAAGDKDDIWAIRPYVLQCSDKDPVNGVWKELGMMQAAEGDDFSFQEFSLDMTVFEHRKEWYCVWAEKVGVGKMVSNLYIAKMETPWKLKTIQVLLTTPDYEWERVDFWVNEGAAFLTHENRVYLTFSASATGACYCMGLMYAEADADLLDPASWVKLRQPVFASDSQKEIYGPGHNCFVKSEDGSEDVMIYHARPYDEIIGNPLYDSNRHAYRLDVRWEENLPVFRMTPSRAAKKMK